VIGCTSVTQSHIDDAYQADNTITVPEVFSDGPSNCLFSPYVLNSTVAGPAILAGQAGPQFTNNNVYPSPIAAGQYGILRGKLFAQTDDARRAFGPVATRFTNLAQTLPTGWANAPGTTGGSDPTGGTNAATYSVASQAVYSASRTVAVGDTLIFGAWVRSHSANGYASAYPIKLDAAGQAVFPGGASYISALPLGQLGSGNWEWAAIIAPIVKASTTTISCDVNATSTYPLDVFAPVLINIPASAGLTTTEVYAYARTLQTYRNDASVGQVSLLPGQQFKADSAVIATVTGSVTGTASALAATPSQCSGGQIAVGVAANGNANCTSPTGSGTVTSIGAGIGLTSSTTNPITGAGSLSVDCDPLNITVVCIDEEFIGTGNATGSIGTLGWALGNVVAGSAAANVSYTQAWPWIGSLRINGSNTSGNGAFLGLAGSGFTSSSLSSQTNWGSYFAYSSAYATATTQSYRVGYITANNAIITPKDGFYLRFDPSLTAVASATYTSGGTITGSATQTCNAAFQGGTATATIALTGTNTIAGSTAFSIVSNGVGYSTANPTTKATLTNGTASCSGTATVAVVNGAAGSGADSTVKLCAEATSSYLETCADTGVSTDANQHVLRIRGIASGEVGLTLDSGSEVTFCSSGCTVTLTPTTAANITPGFEVVSNAAATYGELFVKFWRFKAWGLTFP
jgi:hypothetical protein